MVEFSENTLSQLETQLDNFDSKIREQSLIELISLLNNGDIKNPVIKEVANLHCHTFFSFNGYGYSPTHLAWLAKKNGIKFMGVVDFDVLDAVDEFLNACEVCGIRGTAGMETRVYIPEFETREINSPGEPGVLYHMGTGFVRSSVPDSAIGILKNIKERASSRNLAMTARINEYLSPLHVDYETDILPLTPSGTATERHMVKVIAEKADREIDNPIAFWSSKLKIDESVIEKTYQDKNKFTNLLRSKLMKRGGVGYVQPTAASFPSIDEFHRIMQSCHALPCSAWLDGTSVGEQAIEELLTLLLEKDVAAINIIPDRNWNIADTEIKNNKIHELNKIVTLANQMDLPILVGTEMNKFGQKIVDDFETTELESVKGEFIKGANFLYGHTQLERYWGIGYNSDWSNIHFNNRKSKNMFYENAGQIIKPGLKDFSENFNNYTPKQVLDALINRGD